MTQTEEYEKELKELTDKLAETNKNHDNLVEQNEKEHCDIRYEMIIQWENSITICELRIKVCRLERDKDLLKGQLVLQAS